MSDLEIGAIVAVSVWLALITLLVLAAIRQIALLTVTGASAQAPRTTGVDIGTRITGEAAAALDRLRLAGPAYFVFLSPTCQPCITLARDLAGKEFGARVLALYSGEGKAAEALRNAIPAAIETIADPDATTIAAGVQVAATPMALQIENGVVTGKAQLRGVDDLKRLIEAYEISDAHELAQRGGFTSAQAAGSAV